MRNARLPMRNDKKSPKAAENRVSGGYYRSGGGVTHSGGTPSETRHAARRASSHNADEMPSQS